MSDTLIEIPKRAFLPAYRHIQEDYPDFDIDFLYGGRDSGKSRFVCQILVVACLESNYFRCVLCRKVFNTIKDSTYQMIKDIVIAWGLEDLFTFKTSPLEIDCVNGNKFICRGFDEPAKLRSISNPSHAFVDEGNQLETDDFVTLLTTLRYSGRVKVFFAFNPEAEGNYEDFWLYKDWFAHTNELSWTWQKEIKISETLSIQLKVRATHTTYKDNPFCTTQRQALLEQLSITSPYYYLVFTLGKWGNRKNDAPFAYAFSREKHVGVAKQSGRSGILSFDFNKNPITAGVYELIGKDELKCLESIKLENSDIYRLCDYIIAHYPRMLWQVTGDATGKNSSALVQDNINYYTVIKKKLNLSIGQIKVPSVNPPIEENQVLVNAVLALCKVTFDKDKAKALIFDCENVRMLPTGKIDKSNRENITQQADSLDHFRYLCNTFFRWVLKN